MSKLARQRAGNRKTVGTKGQRGNDQPEDWYVLGIARTSIRKEGAREMGKSWSMRSS